MNKEHNFVSAVFCIQSDQSKNKAFIRALNDVLNEHFLNYEIIAVNSIGVSLNDELREIAYEMTHPLSIVNMVSNQPHEQCMNAGLDLAIGDYVFEFDFAEMLFPIELVWEAYKEALDGNDVVVACPDHERIASRLYYHVFQKHSNIPYRMRSDVFHLLSRRAVNRCHAMNENLPYRKAAYATCGLQVRQLIFKGGAVPKQKGRAKLGVDSLLLYTNFGYKFGIYLTLLMLLVTICLFLYTLIIKFIGNPTPGWASIVCVMTLCFTGVFAILSVVLKYLSLILLLIFKKQSYITGNITKY